MYNIQISKYPNISKKLLLIIGLALVGTVGVNATCIATNNEQPSHSSHGYQQLGDESCWTSCKSQGKSDDYCEDYCSSTIPGW